MRYQPVLASAGNVAEIVVVLIVLVFVGILRLRMINRK